MEVKEWSWSGCRVVDEWSGGGGVEVEGLGRRRVRINGGSIKFSNMRGGKSF